MTAGRELTDAEIREGFLEAEAFVANTSLDTPNATGKELENDQAAYILSKLKDIVDTIAVQSTEVAAVVLFPQETAEDVIVPTGYNAITAIDAIGVGFELTVAVGSKLYHVSEEETNGLLAQINASTDISLVDISTNYTVSEMDISKTLRNEGAAITITVPDSGTVDYVVGNTVGIMNRGSGNITITAGGSLVITGGTTVAPGATAVLIYDDVDTMLLVGDAT